MALLLASTGCDKTPAIKFVDNPLLTVTMAKSRLRWACWATRARLKAHYCACEGRSLGHTGQTQSPLLCLRRLEWRQGALLLASTGCDKAPAIRFVYNPLLTITTTKPRLRWG